ncbi:MAG: efflux RND transporter permease subunit, partial [Eubacteriales bacterium]|nr:efflux RND transporter permease subunit [Eubacteriales bacterium]
MGVTKFVLKRPVTVFMALLCLLVFGISSVFHATLEQMPDTDQPMLIVRASYSGAGPEDVDELVTQVIEDAVSTLEGVESVSSTSSEGSAMVMLEYGYDEDMSEAYDELKQTLDGLRGLPEDADVSVMEMSMNAGTTLMLSISHSTEEDLYDYVDQNIVPVLEQLSTVAEVSSMGGSSEYIRVELKPEKMKQYQVTTSLITSAISAADLSYPSGNAVYGNLDLSVTTSIDTDTLDELLQVPITTASGKTVYLEDIADVYTAKENRGGISKYNGQETISISVTKKQESSAMACSDDVHEAVEKLMAEDSDLTIEIARDTSETILDSLKDVAFTMILAVGISMVIILMFFGDFKASLIVGSSIPTSILVSLILMTQAGFSLNVITMSALTLGVGMMVDNSIVVLESCFRALADMDQKGLLEYARAALEGTNLVVQSIFGSTVTTCVVFIPLVFLNGMSGQMFGPMGYTIVFCMTASLLSAISIVPLTYMLYKPKETDRALMSRPMARLQEAYRKLLPVCLKHKAIVLIGSVLMVIATLMMAGGMETELMPQDSTGQISVSVETRPGLLDAQAEAVLTEVETIVGNDENVDSYMVRYNNGSGSVTAYLKDTLTMTEDDIVTSWENQMVDIENCTIEVSADGSMSFMGRSRGYEVILNGTDYDEIKEVSDEIVAELTARDDVMNVHSDLENTAPVVTVKVDQVAASAEGLTASQIGSQVKSMFDSVELTTLIVDGQEIDVIAEYPEDEYRTVSQLEDVILTTGSGTSVALMDVAQIEFRDNPSSISKSDKKYQITITADYTGENTKSQIDSEVIAPKLSSTITQGVNSRDRMMSSEFSALYQAIAVAVFLVFVVMSAQFESPKFSFMVMTTIPFSLVGSFGLLKITGVSISMTSILGFLIMVGTVVNNGI